MSQPAVAALAPLPFELVYNDGEPLETDWHTIQFPFLRDLFRQAMAERGRTDFYAGGNMFVYYSRQQAADVAKGKPYFRGPDVFWVGGVDPRPHRKCWVAWEEGERLPDVIVELLSPSTAEIDRTVKRDLYARVFRTAEYYMYEPETRAWEGLELAGLAYRSMVPDARGRFWSGQLGVSLGLWHGVVSGREDDWIRLFRADGSLVPTEAEAAEQWAEEERQRAAAAEQWAEAERQRAAAAEQRAEADRQRAEAAEAELARLRALLGERSQA
jgi:Uma2 family endonuclease